MLTHIINRLQYYNTKAVQAETTYWSITNKGILRFFNFDISGDSTLFICRYLMLMFILITPGLLLTVI